MSRFLQIHFLTAYAPSNLNRDDLGRPKTAIFGGTQRLRVSSQSLKRAWRTSEVFAKAIGDSSIGTRTRSIGDYVRIKLADSKLPTDLIEEAAYLTELRFANAKPRQVKKSKDQPAQESASGGSFEPEKAEGDEKKKQLVYLDKGERDRLDEVIASVLREKSVKPEMVKAIIDGKVTSPDLAMFGRMMTNMKDADVKQLSAKAKVVEPDKRSAYTVEAAAQVAHALSVHKVVVEDDYFTAVDDLNEDTDDTGAGHVGTQEFASAVFYQYVCVDLAQLAENLGGDEELRKKTLEAFTRACLTVAPSGKQNSFGSRALASFALAEKGDFQPRSLAVAFLEPVKGEQILADAITRLLRTKENFDRVYATEVKSCALDATKDKDAGSLAELTKFASEA